MTKFEGGAALKLPNKPPRPTVRLKSKKEAVEIPMEPVETAATETPSSHEETKALQNRMYKRQVEMIDERDRTGQLKKENVARRMEEMETTFDTSLRVDEGKKAVERLRARQADALESREDSGQMDKENVANTHRTQTADWEEQESTLDKSGRMNEGRKTVERMKARQAEALETREDEGRMSKDRVATRHQALMAERAAEEAENAKRIEALQTKLEKPRGAKGEAATDRRSLEDASGRVRNRAESLMEGFRVLAKKGEVSEEEWDDFAERLADVRDDLEDENRKLRLVPAEASRIGDIMNANFKEIEKVQDMIDAIPKARISSPEAAEQRLGSKELSAKDLEKRIVKEYGKHPEELMAGSGVKGLWFRMKNAVGRLANQPSLYDQWRDAKTTEEAAAQDAARRERKRPEIKPSKVQEIYNEEQETEKNREYAVKVLTREKAARIWDEVNGLMTQKGTYAFTAEDYVIASARWQGAVTSGNKENLAKAKTSWDEMNEALGYREDWNPVVGMGGFRPNEAAALGAPSAARARMAEAASAITGIQPRQEAQPKLKRAQVREPEETVRKRVLPKRPKTPPPPQMREAA